MRKFIKDYTMTFEKEIGHYTMESLSAKRIHLMTKTSRSFFSGVIVIPAYLTKGLEFDGVLLYNAGANVYQRKSDRKLLYTACTRALHDFFVYYAGELTQLLAEAMDQPVKIS
ncbi:ATP-binding domain-containing protein [Fodinisporobacter ferrooxydans]|uniref:ATP-binding domain-containing protein n=1 Tax=Fodinisporobacter ferrooxydans TaxID=2901836 RepID=A0ABY4CJP2_9BACL|nr:ATP-binding domain-containing protein [Alicyclobacillaceae bacterium MYW30-H2]